VEDALANYLKMLKRQQVIALLALRWSFRRIERETGVRRETISRYVRQADSNPAKTFPGSGGAEGAHSEGFEGPDASNPAKTFPGSGSNPAKTFAGSGRFAAATYHDAIVGKLDLGLTMQRIYQDLGEEFGYGYSYESVKRYIRTLEPKGRACGVMHSLPAEEAQVDFFQGPPTLDGRTGQWRRPWVFRMTLCHSRHGCEEAVWDQKLETFLALHENAFRDFGGVPNVVRHDNMKAAVVRACFYDPDMNVVWAAFAKHWDFTPLPILPRNPKENGKQERSGGYVKSNALKGRRFNSLEELNAFLRHWNRTVARVRIHGTTRRQVFTHFLETDKKALKPLASTPFAFFRRATRTVHPDGHIEVEGAFYPVPPHLANQDVEVRFDRHLVRIFIDDPAAQPRRARSGDEDEPVAVHARVAPGNFARGLGPAGPSSSQLAFLANLLTRCERIGAPLREWAEAAHEERGVRALRLIQGVLSLVRKHPKELVLAAAKTALTNRLFRYKDLRRLTEAAEKTPKQKSLLDVHESIRPMADYRLETL
jgi:Integrase core domain